VDAFIKQKGDFFNQVWFVYSKCAKSEPSSLMIFHKRNQGQSISAWASPTPAVCDLGHRHNNSHENHQDAS
jgi:hypothetical protein